MDPFKLPPKLSPLTPEEDSKLSDKEYWERCDHFAAEILIKMKSELGGNLMTQIDALLSALSALALLNKFPISNILTRLAGSHNNMEGKLEEHAKDQNIVINQKADKGLLN